MEGLDAKQESLEQEDETLSSVAPLLVSLLLPVVTFRIQQEAWIPCRTQQKVSEES